MARAVVAVVMVEHMPVALAILRPLLHHKEIMEDQGQETVVALNLLEGVVAVRLLLDRMRPEHHQAGLVERERLVQLPAQVLPVQVVVVAAHM